MARVAITIGPDYEDSEFDVPVAALKEAGHEVVTVGSNANDTVKGKQGKSRTTVDISAEDAQAGDFSAVVIPGGYSPDHLRMNESVVRFIDEAVRNKTLIAAVCHGPSLLIEADACRGVKMTSWPSIRKDLVNAGAHWEDEPVVIDGTFITSRKPDDLDAFSEAIISRLGGETATSTDVRA